MHEFICDSEKCIACGKCVKECLLRLLTIKDGVSVMSDPAKCIGCLHCFAVCPTGAIVLDNYKPENAPVIEPLPTAAAMKAYALQRRSIRQFKQENCDRAQVSNILDLAWNAASGVNQHLIHLSVIDDMQIMEAFRRKLYEELKKLAVGYSGPLERMFRILGKEQDKWLEEDKVLRHAPHFVVCSHSGEAITGLPDVFIYLSLFEALAVSNGIGTLWCGYLNYCLKALPAMRQFLGIPTGYEVGYPVLFGKPAVKYARGIYRRPASINFARGK